MFVIIATWDEPTSEAAAIGPYPSLNDAQADLDNGTVQELFMNEGELPEDVRFVIQTMIAPPEGR